MKTNNFKIPRQKWLELNELGDFAEERVYSDPDSSLIMFRGFAEHLGLWIFSMYAFELSDEVSVRPFYSISQHSFRGELWCQ